MSINRLNDLHVLVVRLEGAIEKIAQDQNYCKTDQLNKIAELSKLIGDIKESLKIHEEKDEKRISLLIKKLWLLYGY
jgi:hypothetical protein